MVRGVRRVGWGKSGFRPALFSDTSRASLRCLLLMTSPPPGQSGPCTSPDCLSGGPFSGISCKNWGIMYTVFEPGTIRRFYARQREIRAGKCTLMDNIGWRNSARNDLRVLPEFFCQQNANMGVFLQGDFLRVPAQRGQADLRGDRAS
jgi:hypothetical protein